MRSYSKAHGLIESLSVNGHCECCEVLTRGGGLRNARARRKKVPMTIIDTQTFTALITMFMKLMLSEPFTIHPKMVPML